MWICISYWSHDCINLGNDYHDLSVPCYEPLSGSFFIRLHTQYATFTFLDHETYIGTRIDVKLPQKWSSVFFMGRRGLTKMLPLLLSPESNEPSTLLQHDNMSDRLFLSFKCVQMFLWYNQSFLRETSIISSFNGYNSVVMDSSCAFLNLTWSCEKTPGSHDRAKDYICKLAQPD